MGVFLIDLLLQYQLFHIHVDKVWLQKTNRQSLFSVQGEVFLQARTFLLSLLLSDRQWTVIRCKFSSIDTSTFWENNMTIVTRQVARKRRCLQRTERSTAVVKTYYCHQQLSKEPAWTIIHHWQQWRSSSPAWWSKKHLHKIITMIKFDKNRVGYVFVLHHICSLFYIFLKF